LYNLRVERPVENDPVGGIVFIWSRSIIRGDRAASTLSPRRIIELLRVKEQVGNFRACNDIYRTYVQRLPRNRNREFFLRGDIVSGKSR